MTAFWPNLDHCTLADAQSVYEPAEDTYLLADALDSDAEVIRAALAAGAGVTLEVGSGSGAVTAPQPQTNFRLKPHGSGAGNERIAHDCQEQLMRM